MNATKRTITLISPFLATPLWGFLIAENYLHFGGGDKDLAILILWVLWSLIFIVTGISQWQKEVLFKRWAVKSFGYSVLVLLVLWLSLLIYSVATTR